MKVKEILQYLRDEGFMEIPGRSTRYKKFMKDDPAWHGVFLFVGRKGAVRKGKSVSDSRSLTANYRKII